MNKIKDFYAKHEAKIAIIGVGVAVAAAGVIVLLVKNANNITISRSDFNSDADFEDFSAAMQLAKKYDVEATFVIK